MIHVNRGTTSLGVFSEQEIREGLSAGRFAPTDIGWREGMATWQPLSQFPEFGGTAAPTVPPVQPGATPASTTVAGRPGLPWEHRQERGFFNAFIETLSMVLTRPAEAFSVMRSSVDPWAGSCRLYSRSVSNPSDCLRIRITVLAR